MITLYGSFSELEALTTDLRRNLLSVGLLVVKELDTEGDDKIIRRLWIGEICFK